jgi:hypothetical protein
MYGLEARVTFVGWVMYFQYMRPRAKKNFAELSAVYRGADSFAAGNDHAIAENSASGQLCTLAWNFVREYPSPSAPKTPEFRASKPPRDSLICRMEFIGHVFRQGDLRYGNRERMKLTGLLKNAIWFSVAQFALIQRYRRTGDLSQIAYEFFHAYPRPMLLMAPNEYFVRGLPKEEDAARKRDYEHWVRALSAEEYKEYAASLFGNVHSPKPHEQNGAHHVIYSEMLRKFSDNEYAAFVMRREELDRANWALEKDKPERHQGPRFRATKECDWEKMRQIYFSIPIQEKNKKTPHLS